jgi:hypothetical protein
MKEEKKQKKNCSGELFEGTAHVGIMPTWAVLPPQQTTQIERKKKKKKTTTKDSNPKALIPCYSLYDRFRHKRWRLLYYSTYP